MSVAVQNVMRAICCPRLQSDLGALVQCRGTRPNRRQLLSTVTVVSFVQRRESGFITTPDVVQHAENQSKNRDEFINFIVRVRCRVIIGLVMNSIICLGLFQFYNLFFD